MIEQLLLAIVLGLACVFAFSVWSQGYVERSGAKHTEALRREVIKAMGKDPFADNSPMGIKTFYSKRLLDRLYPALNHAQGWDDGYVHALIR